MGNDRAFKAPKSDEDLQTEVRGIAGGRPEITDEDLEKDEAIDDAKVMDFDISAGTMIITNAFAIGRHPSFWDEPDEFRPERSLNSGIDFRGHDFQSIPFGAGRRGCPGISFAMATDEHVLANLMLKFDWDLPDGAKGTDLDMTECTGLIIHKKVPLLAVPTPVW
nr:cytochrome P450 71A6-like [Coffea arabica]